MAIIYSYPEGDSALQNDRLIITRIGEEGNKITTKQLTVDKIAEYTATTNDIVTGNGTPNYLPIWGADGSSIVDSQLRQVGNNLTVGASATITGDLTVNNVFANQLRSSNEVGLRLESDSLLGTKIRIENSNETHDTFISSRGGNVNIGRVNGVSTNNLNIKKENGFVGIKQKAPLAPLHVKNNGEAIRLESTGNNVCSIDFRNGTSKKGHIEYSNDTLEIKTTNPSGARSVIKFSTAIGEGVEAVERMRIKGSQVVIGNPISVPSNKEFYVNGATEVTGDLLVGDDVSINGRCDADSYKLKGLNDAPPTANSSGVNGEIRYTSDYIYVCVQNNVWKRTPLTTW